MALGAFVAVAALMIGIGFSLAPHVAAAGLGDAALNFSPVTVQPGAGMQVSGHCGSSGGTSVNARVHVDFENGQAGWPFDYGQNFSVAADGTFDGALAIPVDAPAGNWNISLSCSAGDVVFATTEAQPFTVAGDPLDPPVTAPPTTVGPCILCIPESTTSTLAPTTTTVPEATPPARPVVASKITYTG